MAAMGADPKIDAPLVDYRVVPIASGNTARYLQGMSKPNRQMVRSLMTTIAHLEAELAGCTTAAMRKCVQETLDDARRQLAEASK